MNTNTVTPETGSLLAAAGFPQPQPAPGQWWGDGERLFCIFRKWDGENEQYFTVVEALANSNPVIDRYFDARDFTGLVFMPTVGDILREMPAYDIGYYTTLEGNPAFVVFDHNAERAAGSHCPAEAAALSYLSIHEKK